MSCLMHRSSHGHLQISKKAKLTLWKGLFHFCNLLVGRYLVALRFWYPFIKRDMQQIFRCSVAQWFCFVQEWKERLKLPLYLHDFRSEIQFGRVEISFELHCIVKATRKNFCTVIT